jgi:hypothetical protein
MIKKSGALHLMHNLQPLNVVTICNSSILPLANQVIEVMVGHACYSMLNLFVGYDHCMLNIASHNLTTIQSPISVVRLTCLPQGWTNTGVIFHKDVTFLLESEIPHITWPYMDDCSIKGPTTRYEFDSKEYEMIPRTLTYDDSSGNISSTSTTFSTTSATPVPQFLPRNCLWQYQKLSFSATSATMKVMSLMIQRSHASGTGPPAKCSLTSECFSGLLVSCRFGSTTILYCPSPD